MARDPRSTAMMLSLLVAVLMLVGKISAYLLTGSAAILSDAAESVIHIAATGFAAVSLRYAKQPPDAQHPYGHGKISFFSAGAEGALIFIAATGIIIESIRALIVGPQLSSLHIGLLITLVLTLVNLWLGLHLIHTGKKHGTLILVANGEHVLTDMWTSVGVLVGVFIVWLTDIVWLDPAVGLVMGLHIAWGGVKLIRRALGGLLDEASPKTTDKLHAILKSAIEAEIIGAYHQLRHRRIEDTLWVEMHMLLPEDLNVREAHSSVTEVEQQIMGAFPKLKVRVTTHIEPLSVHDDDHPGGHESPNDPLG